MSAHCVDIEAGPQGIVVGIGFNLSAIEIELLTPHQAGLLTLLDDVLKETPEGVDTIAVANASQAGMIGEQLVEIVTEIPAQAEAVGSHSEQLAFGADPLEEHDELQL